MVSALLPSFAPAHHRTRATSNLASDSVERIALSKQGNGAMAAVFQKIRASLRSWHSCCGKNQSIPIFALFMQQSIILGNIQERRCTSFAGTGQLWTAADGSENDQS
jgi:hypothetical protein